MIISRTKQLEEYRDKCYVNNILCQLSSEYYGRYKNIFSIPLILSSSIMSILNSSDIKADNMKIANVVINGSTVLLIALMNNFKFMEKQNNFRAIGIKFNKLTHYIEDKLAYHYHNVKDDNEMINNIIKEYDTLCEALEYPFPETIKNKVKELYKDNKTLPNVLNCVKTFSHTPLNGSMDDGIKLKNSIIFMPEKHIQSPRVINTKPFSMITEKIEGLDENV